MQHILEKYDAVIYNPSRCSGLAKEQTETFEQQVLFVGNQKTFKLLKDEVAKLDQSVKVKKITLTPYQHIYGSVLKRIPKKLIDGIPNTTYGFTYMYAIYSLFEKSGCTSENIKNFCQIYSKFNYIDKKHRVSKLFNILVDWDPKTALEILTIITNIKNIYSVLNQTTYVTEIKTKVIDHILSYTLGKYMEDSTSKFIQPCIMGGANMPRCTSLVKKIKDIDIFFFSYKDFDEAIKIRDKFAQLVINDTDLQNFMKVYQDISLSVTEPLSIMENVDLRVLSLKLKDEIIPIMDISVQRTNNRLLEKWLDRVTTPSGIVTYTTCEYMEKLNDDIIDIIKNYMYDNRNHKPLLKSAEALLKFVYKNLLLKRTKMKSKKEFEDLIDKVIRARNNIAYMDMNLYDWNTVVPKELIDKIVFIIQRYEELK